MDKKVTILKVSFDKEQANANAIEALKNAFFDSIKLETADADE